MIAALYCRKNSVYRDFPDVDVYDEDRDALTYPGGSPVIAHPPCGPWGKLRRLCKASEAEREHALFALSMVRTWGGVLEHPSASALFNLAGVNVRSGQRDEYGGYCVVVPQCWFGHRAYKLTAFYICGVEPLKLPAIPFTFALPETTVERMCKAERERTPLLLAAWLYEIAAAVAESRRLAA